MKRVFYIAILIVLMCGCRAQKPLVAHRDSVRVEYRHDSVFVLQKDSIWRDRWRDGDTVYVTTEKWQVRWRDRFNEVHDTITVTATEQVAVEVVPAYYKRVSTGFWILLALLVLLVGWKIAKVYLKIQSGGLL